MNRKLIPKRDRFALLLRAKEMRIVATFIGRGNKMILEIGGQNGWQAHLLEKKGHNVTSIDTSPLDNNSSFSPVLKYNGHNIPFKDSTFDIVFSSNVLEHIPHLEDFEKEILRVLKPNGQAIHVLPTSSWRIWTSLTHPFRVLHALKNRLYNSHKTSSQSNTDNSTHHLWRYIFWPNRHGEKGNSFSEIYWFSQSAWTQHFKKTGWHIKKTITTSLFYTGQMAMNTHLSISTRRTMARFFGAATKIYILEPTQLSGNPKVKHATDSRDRIK